MAFVINKNTGKRIVGKGWFVTLGGYEEVDAEKFAHLDADGDPEDIKSFRGYNMAFDRVVNFIDEDGIECNLADLTTTGWWTSSR